MAISHSDVTGIILSGGRSSRMGKDKALLDYMGKSFLAHAYEELSFCRDIIISCGENEYMPLCGHCIVVKDIYRNKGPLSGIHAALQITQTEYAFVLSVDLPLFTSKFGLSILEEMDTAIDAVVPRTSDGRIHPLCALYRCSVSGIVGRLIAEDRLRVTDLLENIRTRFLDVGDVSDVVNVNTKEDYKNLDL